MYYYDYSYLIFVLPPVILSIIASYMVKSRFNRYSKVSSKRNLTATQAAQLILRANGITDVSIRHISGNLTDNYNPSDKTLSLSDSTYSGSSIAAIGVAAHEAGHAIQHHTHYGPLFLRSTLVPAANLGSQLGPTLVIAGVIFGSASNSYSRIAQIITLVGIALFAIAVLFYLITLPVEFNASRRALKILSSQNLLDAQELSGVRKVLWAAAMTYVASALVAVGNLLRLVLLSKRNNRR